MNHKPDQQVMVKGLSAEWFFLYGKTTGWSERNVNDLPHLSLPPHEAQPL